MVLVVLVLRGRRGVCPNGLVLLLEQRARYAPERHRQGFAANL
jgi:hypothetical protein